jgi:hypothetical protein
MKTTFELEPKKGGINEKALVGSLFSLPNIGNISVDTEQSCISFEYMVANDLDMVRRELHDLGYMVINDTSQFNRAENPS